MFFPGSPFAVKVTGEGRIKESITRKRQASSLASVGSTCGLNLKIPGEYRRRSEMVRGRRVILKLPHSYISILTAFSYHRKLVSDGFSSGEADPDVHSQQPHIHPHRAHRDQQNSWRRDQEGGARGGEHSGGRRRKSFQRCFWGLSGPRESEQLCRPHSQT